MKKYETDVTKIVILQTGSKKQCKKRCHVYSKYNWHGKQRIGSILRVTTGSLQFEQSFEEHYYGSCSLGIRNDLTKKKKSL
jgi:hypothetical protein